MTKSFFDSSIEIPHDQAKQYTIAKKPYESTIFYGDFLAFFSTFKTSPKSIDIGWDFDRGFDSLLSPDDVFYSQGRLVVRSISRVDDLYKNAKNIENFRKAESLLSFDYTKSNIFCTNLLQLSVPLSTPIFLAFRETKQHNKSVIVPLVEVGLRIMSSFDPSKSEKKAFINPEVMSLWGSV